MKHRILAWFLAVSLVLTLLPASAMADKAEGDVAKIGEETYATLQGAIDDAVDGQTVTLLTAVDENITIGAGKSVRLDLNGQTLSAKTGSNNAVINNNGTLTVVDSTGGGAVTGAEGSTYYTICNHGSMTIGQEGSENRFSVSSLAKVTSSSGPSMVENGWYNQSDKPDTIDKADMTIYGGTFTGGLNTVKNDEYGELTIYGGTYTGAAQNAVYSASTTEIKGGTFQTTGTSAVKAPVYVFAGTTTIEDGTFTCASGTLTKTVNAATGATLIVKGGQHSKAVSAAYCADKYFFVKNPETDYYEASGPHAVKLSKTVGSKSSVVDGYESVAAAVTAAESITDAKTFTLTLLDDLTESVDIPAGRALTLDLNGYTLTNDGNDHTIENRGTLTITGGTGSGIVTQAANKQALYNGGTVTFGTSCRAVIQRPEGTNGYVVYNAAGANMTVDAPVTIKSASGNSSCVVNWGTLTLGSDTTSTMKLPKIDGAYIAVKNDETGVLAIKNNVTITGYDQAVQNWNRASITGGTMNGAVATWAYSDSKGDYAGETTISGGTVNGSENGSVLACWYTGARKAPAVTITGGTISKAMRKGSTSNGSSLTVEDPSSPGGSIAVSGGVFDQAVDQSFCAAGFAPQDNGSGSYGVVRTAAVATIQGADGTETGYSDLQAAVDAVQPGQTIRLVDDVALQTTNPFKPIKIENKGEATSPIILDMNGRTISGSNKASNTNVTNGILRVSGSYVTLTDNSEGEKEKGGIENTALGSASSSVLVIETTGTGSGAVTIDGGVRLVNSMASSTASVIYLANKNADTELELTVEDAQVSCAGGYAVNNATKEGFSSTVTIAGGAFKSTTKANTLGILASTVPGMLTISGGTFHNWNDSSDWRRVAEDHVICVAGSGDDIAVTVSEAAPTDYAAYAEAADGSPAVYLISGDLYAIHFVQAPNGKTIHVAKDSSYTFPADEYFGATDGSPYTLTLALDAGVTLSGGMPLRTADVTVTGDASLDGSFACTPFDSSFAMTADGEDGLYSCRPAEAGVAAKVITPEGTELSYTKAAGAFAMAATIPGSTVRLCQDAGLSTLVALKGAEVTLDLNGFTLTYTGSNQGLLLSEGTKLTVKDASSAGGGQLAATSSSDNAAAIATTSTGGGEIVIEETALITGAIFLDAEGSRLTVAGTIDTTARSSTAYPISGSGSDGRGNTSITIEETAVIKAPTGSPAIYHPQSGTLTVKGGSIEGSVGIQMCSGTLEISGSPTITATGANTSGGKTGDGPILDGAAISIVNRGYPGGTPTVTITGTPTVTAASGVDAVQAYTWNAADKTQEAWEGAGDSVSISGGTYSTRPDGALLADGCAVTEQNGKYIVKSENPEHVHDWSGDWTSDGDAHWHACTAEDCDITEDNQKNGYAAHTMDEGTETKKPTMEETGTKVYRCTVCGYVMKTETLPVLTPPEHTHEGAKEWTADAANHWHACTAGDGEKLDVGAHVYDDDADGTCNICGYVRELEVEGETYTITASAENGKITPDGETRVRRGDSLTVKYQPKDGFKAESVLVQVDGFEVDAPDSYTFRDVTGGHIILVKYTEKTEEPNEPDEPEEPDVTITISGPNGDRTTDEAIILDEEGNVTGLQTAQEIGGALMVPGNNNPDLPYWTYKGWTFTAEKDGRTETFGTCKTLTQELAEWLTEKISEGGWTLKMDSRTPGVYKPSGSSGGGGGSSSSSTTKTETTKNPDGSTTTTVTDTKTGTVTETVKTADGVTGTTVTDKNGDVTKVTASVPADVARDAAKTGETVTLPVEVPAVKDADDAPAVSVTVPKSSGAVKVEIPVEKVTSGTVAVLVKADGTEEIVKTSVTTEDGVALTVEGSATVKVIDNSKYFVDVHPVDHWAEGSIDFVASREIFTGTTANTFTPEAPTTRGQLMTVLARLDGAEASGSGAIQKGMAWAVEKGVSDGSNPGGTITRQQLAAMLYRYAGSPATDYELTHPDASKVSDYAVDAMRWAVGSGIITGKADGTLDPHGLATRAQVATMMARFCSKTA